MTRFIPALFTALLLGACNQPGVDPAMSPTAKDAQQLQQALQALLQPPVVGGCSDLSVYAAGNADKQALFLHISGGVIEDAYEGGATSLVFELPHPDVSLEVQWGRDLTINECDDVFMGQPHVRGGATAVSGTVFVDLELLAEDPEPWDLGADATISMEQVLFETDAGNQRTYDVDLGTTYVGWFPG